MPKHRNFDPIEDTPDGCIITGCALFVVALLGIVGGLIFVIWAFGYWLIS